MRTILALCLLAASVFGQENWLKEYFVPSKEFQLAQFIPPPGHIVSTQDIRISILPEITLTNGLFAYWPLDETGDDVRNDIWGGHHLYVRDTANVNHTGGIISNAVDVSAVNGAGEMTNNAAGITFNTFTIAFWLNPKFQSGTTYMYCGSSTSARNYGSAYWGLYSNPGFRFIVSANLYSISSATFNLNEWSHWTFVYSNSAARVWAYKNGQYNGTVATGTLGTYTPVSFSLYGASDYGAKDEVLLWSRGLEPWECELVYRMKQWKDWRNLRYR